MTITGQTCTLEQGIQIKELGLEQGKTYFVHAYDRNVSARVAIQESADAHFAKSTLCDAHTVAELGEILTSIGILDMPAPVRYQPIPWVDEHTLEYIHPDLTRPRLRQEPNSSYRH